MIFLAYKKVIRVKLNTKTEHSTSEDDLDHFMIKWNTAADI